MSIVVCGVVAVSLVVTASGALPTSSAAADPAGGPCQFQKADQPLNVAFCDTFDQPAGTGTRSGDLNSTVWGVSRQLGNSNFGQGQYDAALPTTLQKCGQSVQVIPPNDVAICNGQVAESVTDGVGVDNGTVTDLAMYPKQPFDIAGRTGTIAFDVSDDSHGNHRAWPELWYTDQPVPSPFDHFSSLQSVPKNGFGVRFAAYCPPGQLDCRVLCPSIPSNVATITVDSADVVNNFVSDDSFMDVGTGSISVKQVGCVRASSGPGNMNHFELRVSQHEIDVYGTDAGNPTGPMTELAVISNMTLTLTRGLIWTEDVHYNGNKDGIDQGTHTFTWDNVGFDGPTLPRDLAFDALDSLKPTRDGMVNLGWAVSPSDPTPLSVAVLGVYNIANASAALLTFNYGTDSPVTISYRVNNGAWHDEAWPFGPCFSQNGSTMCGPKTIGLPVPLSDVQPGTNTVQFKSTNPTIVANVDLILVGAAGKATGAAGPAPAPPPAAGAMFTAPPAGATLLDGTQPISWTSAPGAQGYYLTVGTTPGGYDVVNSGALSAGVTSYPMPPLPTGVALYGRLYTANGGGYVASSDVKFSAASGAHFTYPVDGEEAVDTTRLLTWTPDADAKGYYVIVGTTEGGSDLINSGALPSAATSIPVDAALPAGRPLYARIYTKVGGAFSRYQDIKFTARPGRAVLTDPSDGAVGIADLPSFHWTPVAGAVGYDLTVGTAPGKYDVINSGTLAPTATSYDPSPLPRHKRLYARVYTELSESQVRFSDITFTT